MTCCPCCRSNDEPAGRRSASLWRLHTCIGACGVFLDTEVERVEALARDIREVMGAVA
jgi:hypothetical protein